MTDYNSEHSFKGNTADSGNDAAICLQYLQSFSNGDAAFEKDILQTSMQELQEQVTGLQNALASGNLDNVHQMAHSAKNLSSIVGSKQLYGYFRDVEYGTHQPGGPQLEQAINLIQQTWAQVRQELENMLACQYNHV